MDIVIDEKQKLQKLNIYYEQTPVIAIATISSGHLNLSPFYYY